jgi:hypothetical protein
MVDDASEDDGGIDAPGSEQQPDRLPEVGDVHRVGALADAHRKCHMGEPWQSR